MIIIYVGYCQQKNLFNLMRKHFVHVWRLLESPARNGKPMAAVIQARALRTARARQHASNDMEQIDYRELISASVFRQYSSATRNLRLLPKSLVVVLLGYLAKAVYSVFSQWSSVDSNSDAIIKTNIQN